MSDMSTTTSAFTAVPENILYTEIARFAFTTDDKTTLRYYFTNNADQRNEAVSILPTCTMDEQKFVYPMRFLMPGIFSPTDSIKIY